MKRHSEVAVCVGESKRSGLLTQLVRAWAGPDLMQAMVWMVLCAFTGWPSVWNESAAVAPHVVEVGRIELIANRPTSAPDRRSANGCREA